MARAKTTKKPCHHRFEVLRDDTGAWCFVNADVSPREVLEACAVKADAVWFAASHLADAWSWLCIRSELVIRDSKGRIQDRRSYGDDPRRTKG